MQYPPTNPKTGEEWEDGAEKKEAKVILLQEKETASY